MVVYKRRASMDHRIRMVSDLRDAALMTSELECSSIDDLRTACRSRENILASSISWTINGGKHNAPRRHLLALLVNSLLASPVVVATRTEKQRQMGTKPVGLAAGIRPAGPRKVEEKTKVGFPIRVMSALFRSLGPLWQEMMQWDNEFLESNNGRFHGHDGIFMLVAQLKHPTLVILFLEHLESQGFPQNQHKSWFLRHCVMRHLNGS